MNVLVSETQVTISLSVERYNALIEAERFMQFADLGLISLDFDTPSSRQLRVHGCSAGRQPAGEQTMIIQVTQEDIDKGVRCNGWACPIHRALWRCTGQRWIVYSSWAIAVEEPTRRTFQLPPAVCTFNMRFDQAQPVQPFTFEVQIPERKQIA